MKCILGRVIQLTKPGERDAHGMWVEAVDQWACMAEWQNIAPNQSFRIFRVDKFIFHPGFTKLGNKIIVSHTTSFSKSHCSSNESFNRSFAFQKILKIPELLWQSHLITLHHDIWSWSFYFNNFTDFASISSCGHNWKLPFGQKKKKKNFVFSQTPHNYLINSSLETPHCDS